MAAVGATPYVPFKSNTTGEGPELWRRLYHYFMFNRDDFLAHYHKRSNVETAFAMIKGKFGDAVRSKGEAAQVNEVLCKVLCHNLCVLVQAIYELGIEPTFWAESAPAQEGGGGGMISRQSPTIVQVCKHIWSNHEGELRSSGDLFYTWQYDVRWAATRLRKQGKMRGKDTSPRGIWDLA